MISATSPKHATSQEAPGTDPADPAAAWREAWSELQGCPWPKLRPLMDVFGHLQDVRGVLEVLGGELPTARKWVITPVINGISKVNPLITGVITHLRAVG